MMELIDVNEYRRKKERELRERAKDRPVVESAGMRQREAGAKSAKSKWRRKSR